MGDEDIEAPTNPLREIFADLLASAENMYLHHKSQMPPSDQKSRAIVIDKARANLHRIHETV